MPNWGRWFGEGKLNPEEAKLNNKEKPKEKPKSDNSRDPRKAVYRNDGNVKPKPEDKPFGEKVWIDNTVDFADQGGDYGNTIAEPDNDRELTDTDARNERLESTLDVQASKNSWSEIGRDGQSHGKHGRKPKHDSDNRKTLKGKKIGTKIQSDSVTL